jgi:hypothetical protein
MITKPLDFTVLDKAIFKNREVIASLENELFRLQGLLHNFNHKKPFKMDLHKLRKAFNLNVVKVSDLSNPQGTDKLVQVVTDALNVGALIAAFIKKPAAAVALELVLLVAKYEDFKATFITAWAQFKDLDELERIEAMRQIGAGFDIENDVLEAKIEAVVNALLMGPGETLETIEAFTGLLATTSTFKDDPLETIKKISRDHIPELIDQGEESYQLILSLWEAIKAFFEPKENNG